MVVAGGSDTQTVTAADGRTLVFAEWGDLGGFPVFSLHGAPGSRFARHYDESAYAEVGARVITYDRPGYGGSVGGPHSLAVAAHLPERVTRATCAVGVVPFETSGFDWFAAMDPLNVREIGWALEGEDVLAREIEPWAAEMLERVAADPAKTLGDDWQLSEADRAELARPERHEVMRQMVNEAFRRGIWGYVDDTLCLVRPWGFDVAEISVPTRVVYGLTDVLVPRQHGEWLARNVANAEVVVDEHGGHMADPDQVTESYAWLVQPV